uniref:POPDC1-3 domain-containing protein n=1 Tax=Timema bartmani TaxID=61472 RepID=A0A7R9F2N7_9NEOP|nr:unnamed protein product [Timema bartmani]
MQVTRSRGDTASRTDSAGYIAPCDAGHEVIQQVILTVRAILHPLMQVTSTGYIAPSDAGHKVIQQAIPTVRAILYPLMQVTSLLVRVACETMRPLKRVTASRTNTVGYIALHGRLVVSISLKLNSKIAYMQTHILTRSEWNWVSEMLRGHTQIDYVPLLQSVNAGLYSFMETQDQRKSSNGNSCLFLERNKTCLCYIVYLALFRPLKVTRHQFKKVLNCMKLIRQLKYQEVYAQEKVTKVDSLSLVLSGKLVVSQNSRALHIVFSHQFLDSPEWFGVSTDEFFQVSITAMEESRVLIWHRDKLKLTIITDQFLQAVFDHILGRDVVKKLMQMPVVGSPTEQDIAVLVSATLLLFSVFPLPFSVACVHTPTNTAILYSGFNYLPQCKARWAGGVKD